MKNTAKVRVILLSGFVLASGYGHAGESPRVDGVASAGMAMETLSEAEMQATTGSAGPLLFGAGIFFGGAGAAIGSAGQQYRIEGQIDPGTVALAGLGGAALGAVNGIAAATRSAVAIVTAGGLDLAVTAATAFGEPQPGATPSVSRYEQVDGYTNLTLDGADYTIPPMQPVSGIFNPDLVQPTVVTVPSAAIEPGPESAYGAGEEQYRYF
jgi:hypothetical protein